MAKATLKPTVAAPSQENWWEQNKTAPKVEAQHKILQTITFKLGNFDDDARTFRAVASTPVTDRSGDIIQQDGWELANFMANPVIPWCHDYYQPPVARAIEVGVADGALQFTYQAPPKGLYPFADTIWNLYRNQFMFAFSVGFVPEEPEEGWSWEGNTFTKCELLEISAVVVPANPQALALSLKSGMMDEKAAKILIAKTSTAMKSLEDVMKAESEEAEKEAEAFSDLEAAVEKAVEKVLSKLNPASLTLDKGDGDNDDMNKPEAETNKTAPVVEAHNKNFQTMFSSLHDMADTLKAHSDALEGHAQTMSAHSTLIKQKADVLHKAVDYLKKSIDGDENAEMPTPPPLPDEPKPAEPVVKTAEPAPVADEPAAEEPAPAAEEKPEEPEKPAEEPKPEEEKVEEPTKAEDEPNSGEVKSEETLDGADHEGEAEELVDPDNLTDTQVEKLIEMVNAELKVQESN